MSNPVSHMFDFNEDFIISALKMPQHRSDLTTAVRLVFGIYLDGHTGMQKRPEACAATCEHIEENWKNFAFYGQIPVDRKTHFNNDALAIAVICSPLIICNTDYFNKHSTAAPRFTFSPRTLDQARRYTHEAMNLCDFGINENTQGYNSESFFLAGLFCLRELKDNLENIEELGHEDFRLLAQSIDRTESLLPHIPTMAAELEHVLEKIKTSDKFNARRQTMPRTTTPQAASHLKIVQP